MVIRCPECATRFKVADHLVGEKPIKLKCSKCRTVFTYARKSKPVRSESASHPRMPVVRPGAKKMIGAPAGAPEPKKKMIGAPAEEPEPAPALGEEFESFEEDGPVEEEFESFEEGEPAEEEQQRLAEMKARGEMEVDDEDESTAVFEAAIERQARKAAASAPRPAAGQDQEAVSQPSFSGPAITLDDVLPAPEPASSTGRAVGILSAVLLGLVLVFGLFVMWRNGWDFAALLQDPVHSMRVSLGLAPRELVPAEAKGIDATVAEWFRVQAVGDHEILVVNGEVFNSSAYPKDAVLVEVTIVNSQGMPVFEQEAVAGVTLMTREAMAEKSVLEIREQMQEDGTRARSWAVNPGRRASFQVFFTSYPPGVDDLTLYTIEAHVSSARNAISE